MSKDGGGGGAISLSCAGDVCGETGCLAGAEIVSSKSNVVSSDIAFNPQQLVVFGKTLGSAGGPGLDLAAAKANSKVGNEAVLCFAGSVANHDSPAGIFGGLGGVDRLRNAADLIDFEQQCVGSILLNCSSNPLLVGDKKVISNHLASENPRSMLYLLLFSSPSPGLISCMQV